MDSIWTKTTILPQFPELKQHTSTDVLIIGGGMAGLLCAYFLEKAGIEYILAEGKTIADGITKNTTAKVTFQHGLIYDQLLKTIGPEKTRQYLKANQLAFSQYQSLSKTFACDWEEKDAYVYSLRNREKIEDEIKAYQALGITGGFAETVPLPLKIQGAAIIKNQGQFHPLKFIQGLSQKLNIYENTFIKEVSENVALTASGITIKARKLIFTSHFPFINTHGSYFVKMYQHRSYVIALKNVPGINGMYVDECNTGMSFRNVQDLLLLGGGGHRTGKQGGAWNELRKFASLHYPGSQEVSHWATQDCISLDHIPYIGRYSKHTSDWYVATGFNKWGMTSSMVSAMLLSDLVTGKQNEFESVFSPSRNIVKPQLFINGWEATKNLLTPTKKRCPHLGCALKWNRAEHTWDCPCHGSRFSDSGNLIDNPACKGLHRK